jgi:uncharacterized protein YcbX
MHVASLHRFPVKGLAGEPLDTVELSAGAGVPHDRRFAVLRGDTAYDPASARWVAKEKCVMLVRDHALARLRLRFDPDTMAAELSAPGPAGARGVARHARGARARRRVRRERRRAEGRRAADRRGGRDVSLRKGGGLVDVPGRGLVGANTENPH